MKIITIGIKLFTIFIITTLFSSSIYAVDLPLSTNITKLNGDNNLNTCHAGDIFRVGTLGPVTYNGVALDVLVTVVAEDNEYDDLPANVTGPCIGVTNGATGAILETRLRDRSGVNGSGSDANTAASMDLKITIVEQGTTTPVEVDRIAFSAFDLDTGGTFTATDDIAIIAPTKGYIQENGNSLVTYNEGGFGAGFNVNLTGNGDTNTLVDGNGNPTGNCQDSVDSPAIECRGGGIAVEGVNGPNKISSVNIRVSNDNAYGTYNADTYTSGGNVNAIHRLIQISLKETDFNAILVDHRDHGDAPATYGDAVHIVDVGTVLGYGYPADGENAQPSLANADDNPAVGNIHFDDEDGVRIGNQVTTSSELNMTVGNTYDLNVTTIGNGFLSAWVDLNGDGDFNDVGEKLLDDTPINSVIAINTIIPLVLPGSNFTGTSYARFRFSQNQNVGSNGNGGIGEVEDYKLEFRPAGNVVGHIYNDLNGNGTQDPGEPNFPGVDVVITAANGEIQTVTTDANGDYNASGISTIGQASIDIDETTLPAGVVQTENGDPTLVTVSADVDNFEENNGFYVPAIVSGIVKNTAGTGIGGSNCRNSRYRWKCCY